MPVTVIENPNHISKSILEIVQTAGLSPANEYGYAQTPSKTFRTLGLLSNKKDERPFISRLFFSKLRPHIGTIELFYDKLGEHLTQGKLHVYGKEHAVVLEALALQIAEAVEVRFLVEIKDETRHEYDHPYI